MRLALVCPYSLSRPGGVQAQVLGLARTYQARGHDVSVFAPVDDGPSPARDGIDLVATGRSVPVPANGSVAPVALSPMALGRALRHLRAWQPDVVHVHEPFAPGLPMGLLLARRRHSEVATFHRSGTSLFYRALRPLLRRQGARLAARCAVSEAAATTAATAVDGPIEVLFNGVDVDRDGVVEPWPAEGPAVLFLGRHEERKGLGVLLEAFDRMRKSGGGAGCGLWVAGDGPQRAALERRWPASDDLRWLGTVPEDEKARRLATASVLCAPSLGQESFGIVLLEAMAARSVVVASDIPGYRDAAGGRALLVPPARPDELANALAGVLDGRLAVVPESGTGSRSPSGSTGETAEAAEDGAGRTRWLDEAEERARSFSMDRLAGRYEAIFTRVMEGRIR
jgi:phosphatidyl-myo-inositol alpha-mannosyltransferase